MKRLLVTILLLTFSFPVFAAEKESAYDRVLRTGTLRCGYGLWEPMLMKDPNSGKMSGIFYDYVEALGKALDLKIDWAEEIPFGEHLEALNTGRIDAYCLEWPNAIRAKKADFTQPIYYVAIYPYAKANDVRFDNNLDNIIKLKAKIGTIDGELTSLIAATKFPSAETFALPQLTDPSQLLMNIGTGKADITFTDTYTANKFMEKNPGMIRRVALNSPLRIIPNTLAVKKGETALRDTLNSATEQLVNEGSVEDIIQKYELQKGTLLRTARPYEIIGQKK